MQLLDLFRWMGWMIGVELMIVIVSAVCLQAAMRAVVDNTIERADAIRTVTITHLIAALVALALYSPQLIALITFNEIGAPHAPPASAAFWLIVLIVLTSALVIGIRQKVGFLSGMVIFGVSLAIGAPIAMVLAAIVHLAKTIF